MADEGRERDGRRQERARLRRRRQRVVQRQWRTVRARARRQAGLLTTAQLAGAGVAPTTTRSRIAAGQWQRLQRGVVDVGMGLDTSAQQRRIQGVRMRAGEPSLVTGEAAAWLLGIERRPPSTVEVLVPQSRRIATPRGARVRRASHYPSADGHRPDGIPVPSAAWVLCDLAGHREPEHLARAVATACRLRLTTLDAVEGLAAGRRNARGIGRLRTVVRGLRGGLDHSQAERRLRRACRGAGLEPDPGKVTVWHRGRPVGETDLGFSIERIDVQVDGSAPLHGRSGRGRPHP